MNCPVLALSLTNSFTQIGAVAALAALVGIAILSLLVFSQAREIKRLRDWAGRAPERSAELEQRISTQAAARVQTPPSVRPVPRTAPLNARAAAATGPATRVVPGGTPPTGQLPEVQAPEQAASQATAVPVPIAASTSTAQSQGTDDDSTPTPAPPISPAEGPVVAAASPQAQTGEQQPQTESTSAAASTENESAGADQAPSGLTPAPVTAAARAARAPLPPPPAAGESDERAQTPAKVLNGPSSPGSAPSVPAVPGTRPVSRPATSPSVRRTASEATPAAQQGRPPGEAMRARDYRFLREEQSSPKRTRSVVVGAAIIAALVAVGLVIALGKGGSSPTGATQSSSTIGSGHTHAPSRSPRTSDPATLAVVVLNGTEIKGLAHHLAARLRQSGYSRANWRTDQPTGTYPRTVVRYTRGHAADASSIAQVLGISTRDVQPLEEGMQSLVGGAFVVLITGVDEATRASNAGTSIGAGGSGENGTAP